MVGQTSQEYETDLTSQFLSVIGLFMGPVKGSILLKTVNYVREIFNVLKSTFIGSLCVNQCSNPNPFLMSSIDQYCCRQSVSRLIWDQSCEWILNSCCKYQHYYDGHWWHLRLCWKWPAVQRSWQRSWCGKPRSCNSHGRSSSTCL